MNIMERVSKFSQATQEAIISHAAMWYCMGDSEEAQNFRKCWTCDDVESVLQMYVDRDIIEWNEAKANQTPCHSIQSEGTTLSEVLNLLNDERQIVCTSLKYGLICSGLTKYTFSIFAKPALQKNVLAVSYDSTDVATIIID